MTHLCIKDCIQNRNVVIGCAQPGRRVIGNDCYREEVRGSENTGTQNR